MGRNFRTATPQFVDDFIYTPPWKLMQEVMATKQNQYDTAIQTSEMLKNMIDIKHTSIDEDSTKELTDFYTTSVDDVVGELKQNPGNYAKVMPRIRNLARQLADDKKNGNISKIEGRANALAQWQEENADIKKEDPDNYNRLLNHYYGKLKTDTEENFDATFSGQKGILKPDINSKDMREALKEFKANSKELPNGMWLVNGKELTEQEVQQAAYDLYMANPQAQGYLRQQVMLKDNQYYDAETDTAREIFQFEDKDGNVISRDKAIEMQEAFAKLSPEEKQKQGFPFSRKLNGEHGFSGGFRGWGNILGYSEQSIKENPFSARAQAHGYRTAENAQQNAAAWQRTVYSNNAAYIRDRANWGDKAALSLAEHERKVGAEKEKSLRDLEIKALSGDEDAANALKALTIQAMPKDVPNSKVSYTDNLARVKNKDQQAIAMDQKATIFARNSDLSMTPGPITSLLKDGVFNNRNEGRQNIQRISKDFVTFYDAGIKKGWTADKIIRAYKQKSLANPKAVISYNPEKGGTEASRISDVVYKELIDKYIDAKKKWFDTNATQVVQKEFEPLTTKGQVEMKHLYDSNPSSFEVKNSDGSPYKGTLTSINMATNGSGSGALGYSGVGDNNEKVFVFPKNMGGLVSTTAQNIILTNLKNQGTYLETSLKDNEIKNLDYLINSTGSFKDGSKGFIYKSPSLDGQIPIRVINGRLMIMNPETNKPIDKAPSGFNSSAELINYINKL